MAEEIVRYTVGIDFDTALKKLNTIQTKMANVQKVQAKVAKSNNIVQQAMWKNERAKIIERDKLLQNSQQGFLKLAQERVKATKAINAANIKQAVGNITAPSGAGKAGQTALAQMLREQEAAEKRLVKTEAARVRNLEAAKTSVMNTNFMMSSVVSKEQAAAQAEIRRRVATAQTATEVRKIVAQERNRYNDLRKQTNQLNKQNFLMRRMSSSSKQIAGNMVSAFAIGALGTGVVKVGQDFERANNTLVAITGNTAEAAKEMQYLTDFTYKMGVPLRETAKDYAKLRASAKGLLPVQEQKTLFEDLTKAAVVMGTTSEDTSGIIKALTQMLSKQKIQAEEYRGQLGRQVYCRV